MIPRDVSADCVCRIVDIWDVYHRPPEPLRPLVCFDETSKQLVDHVQSPIDAKPGRAEIIDYEYQRDGTGNIFMMYAPLKGWREAMVTDRRTTEDYARAI